jgi:hypothetical protein
VSAVRDLQKPTRAGGASVGAGESARAFLTVSNSNLKFWCRVADVDMNVILRTYCQGGKVARIVDDVDPDAFDDCVKKPLLSVPYGFMENRRVTKARKSGSAP